MLGTIYEQETDRSIFHAFEKLIAEPTSMEDYKKGWGHYFLHPCRSKHFAYTFWMSARDLARFDLLYLRKGQWEGEQIIPAKWIEISAKQRFKNVYGEHLPLHYGLLWWIRGGKFAKYDAYFASEVGNQSTWILAELEIVFVYRASSDYNQGSMVYGLKKYSFASSVHRNKNPKKIQDL